MLNVSLIIGVIVGVFYGLQQYSRLKSGANKLAIRNPDGSVYGGLIKTCIGVAILWFLIGFGLSYIITSLVS